MVFGIFWGWVFSGFLLEDGSFGYRKRFLLILLLCIVVFMFKFVRLKKNFDKSILKEKLIVL